MTAHIRAREQTGTKKGNRVARRDVTIKEVAALSGVSIATVTRTFQDSPLVRAETSARVRLAAEQLGYRPNSVARALVTGTSDAIGILVPSLVEAYWAEVIDGVERRAGELGLAVVIATTRSDTARAQAMQGLLMSKRVDGMIIAGTTGLPESAHGGSPEPTMPLVLIDANDSTHPELLDRLREGSLIDAVRELSKLRPPGRWLAHVAYDDMAGARCLARHLLELGHVSVAFLAGPAFPSCLSRLVGVRGTLEESQRSLHSMVSAPQTFDGGYEAGRRILSGSTVPTAIVCYNDEMAIGVVRAAHELGFAVPNDVSVVGWDDIAVASYVDPPLTTLRNPKQEAGELALDLLLSETDANDAQLEPQLAGSLIVRGSSGPPPIAKAK
jgi:LacI family transcriptional regulator